MRRPRDRGAARRSGLEVEEDDAGEAIGGDTGNLLARIPGRAERVDPALRAPRHRPARRRPDRAGGRRRRLGERERRDPRRRQQGGGRGDARRRAPRASSTARRSASSCCSPPARRTRSPGAKAFDATSCARAYGYVFDHATPIGEIVIGVADLLPPRGRVPRPGRPRRHPPRGRPQRDRRRRARDRRAPSSAASTHETTANVGDDRGRRRRHERRPRALPLPRRGALARRRARPSGRSPRWSTASRTPPTTRPATSTSTSTSSGSSSGYRHDARRAAGPRRRARAARARGYTPRRIVTGGGSDANALEAARLPVHEPRQRDRAQPRADRARCRSPRSRACST